MDLTRVDRLTIAVGQRSTRRAALGLLAALGLTALGGEAVLAACAENGTPRTSGSGCCSGRCAQAGHDQVLLLAGTGTGHLHDRQGPVRGGLHQL